MSCSNTVTVSKGNTFACTFAWTPGASGPADLLTTTLTSVVEDRAGKTYAIGMLALSGLPLVTSGFWSKDGILHSAWVWEPSKWPFAMASLGALLTAFYMTRQMFYVFFGPSRSHGQHAHESPSVMTIPLVVLAACALLLTLGGTPFWPWFHAYLSGHTAHAGTIGVDVFLTMLLSAVIFGTGVGLGWWFYGRRPIRDAAAPDAIEALKPNWFAVLRDRFYIDELYEMSFIRWNAAFARFCARLEDVVWSGAVHVVTLLTMAAAWFNRFFDEYVINLGFSGSCRGLAGGGGWLARLQSGRVQSYLRALAVAFVLLLVLLMWGGDQ